MEKKKQSCMTFKIIFAYMFLNIGYNSPILEGWISGEKNNDNNIIVTLICWRNICSWPKNKTQNCLNTAVDVLHTHRWSIDSPHRLAPRTIYFYNKTTAKRVMLSAIWRIKCIKVETKGDACIVYNTTCESLLSVQRNIMIMCITFSRVI